MDTFPSKSKQKYFTHGLSGCAIFSITLSVTILIWGAYLVGTNRDRLVSNGRGKSPIPNVPLLKEPVVFQMDKRWEGSDPETHKLWETEHLGGFQYTFVVDNPRDYGLQIGLPDGAHERFVMSMHHQLHCLASIRMAYFNQTDSHKHRREDVSQEEIVKAKLLSHLHVDNCFDYLRQAVQCSADTTIEWPRVEKDGRRMETDGWGVPHHECKDLSIIKNFIAQHQ
ncbi:uncharacterized protein PADG_00749 [Paracoccidioides brasiliensis Pb18]|uniref:DUF3328 domain-containing protein n=1 Tax=Paracoccidioides brasiliensis (strain Pb18) TaxID=502780 RepID=C1G1K9_PARBD|nr:uncharacterized protein PADG_00749 [Paracoccidioides brasiliensis Pb18]EEH44460.2 hypothetical protein PADG_00749 [Paracoccidioides brasiliensis Pb18]